MSLTKIAGLILLVYFAYSYVTDRFLPDVESLRTENPTHTSYMGEKTRRVQQIWVPLEQISQHVRRAVIISEDGRFYQHHGIDFHELKESIRRNLNDQAFSRGFSTISMQLARNLYLTPEKSMDRKFKEILIALWLERHLSKHRIFELYLNLIEWGRGIYGIEAAAQHYFQKSASELSPREATFLAAIIPSPQRFGQWPPTPYIEERMTSILNRMQERWNDGDGL